MKRKIYQDLLDWKKNGNKPLMVLGVRQCGKSYIIDEFGKTEFKNYKYVSLLEDANIIELYNSNLSSDEKFNQLQLILDFDLEQEDSLLFIDEIQESEVLISELKYFCERHNSVKIVCAGSLLGVALKRTKASFPVGKVKMIDMYPMDFEEFLMAFNQDKLIDKIRKCYKNNESMGDVLHNKLMGYYRDYLVTGGMPECIQNMIDNERNYIEYDTNIMESIKRSYFNDMKKYVDSNNDNEKIKSIYLSLPSQLANTSHKFQYSKVEKNARSRTHDVYLTWLLEGYLVNKCKSVTNPVVPLEGFVDVDAFKLYISDVGVLINMLQVSIKDVITDNLSYYKGVITENYVANELVKCGYGLYYWVSGATAEIDFLLYTSDGIIPVEVKSSDNTQSKSLKLYMEKFKPNYAIRISTKDFGFTNNIKSIPLYAVFCLDDIKAK